MPLMKLTPQRNAQRRKDSALVGTPLNYNASQQAKYKKALANLVDVMLKETKKQVIAFFKKPIAKDFYSATMDAGISTDAKKLTDKLTLRFDALFGKHAETLAEGMVSDTEKVSAATLNISLKKLSGGLTFNTKVLPPALKQITKAAVTENVGLIKSIAKNYLFSVEQAVMRSITTSNGLKYLIPVLEKYEGITHRRANIIALDQTRKVYNMVNAGRMQAVGLERFRWEHSGGGHEPRKSHIALSGKIFYLDKSIPINKGGLPVTNKEQVDRGYESPQRGIPGQEPNCKCIIVPVVEFNDEVKNG